MSFLSSFLTIYRCEMLHEWRSRARWLGVLAFCLILAVIFHYTLDAGPLSFKILLRGSALATLFFATVLLSSMGQESSDTTGFDVLMLAPIDRTAAYLARVLFRWILMIAICIFYLPAHAILLTGTLPDPSVFLSTSLLLVGVSLSLSALAALFGSLLAQTSRALLLPLVLLPAAIPLLMYAAQGMAQITPESSLGANLLPAAAMLAPAILYCSVGSLLYPFLYDEGPNT